MTSAALLAIAGFTALGSVFDYPQILQEPTSDILALYREHADGRQRLVPRPGRERGHARPGRGPARPPRRRPARALDRGVGVAAATVQVIGLSRWVLFVPGISEDAQRRRPRDTFELLHTWLGVALGETVGYALTATFTVLVVVGLARRGAPAGWSGSATRRRP